MLTLAFDTATGVATSALVRNGEVLGERSSRAVRVRPPVTSSVIVTTSKPDSASSWGSASGSPKCERSELNRGRLR